jgi:hypothetical protein
LNVSQRTTAFLTLPDKAHALARSD